MTRAPSLQHADFYEARHLPVPQAEHWPQTTDELRDLLASAPRLSRAPGARRVLMGAGLHLSAGLTAAGPWEAVHTSRCRALLKVDRTSQIVWAEAGITWGELQARVREEGLSLHGYGLYPRAATLGGLLARRLPVQKVLWSGDVRDGCVALSAMGSAAGALEPKGQGYRYIPAPRKASGPDLRHLYIGGEGALGAILEVAMVAARPMPGQLWRWSARDLSHAVAIVREVWATGLRPAWSHYTGDQGEPGGELWAAVFAAPSVLRKAHAVLSGIHGGTARGGEDEIEALRAVLERDHPDQRVHPHASRTLAMTWSLADLAGQLARISPHMASCRVMEWSAHHATAWIATHESPDELLARPELAFLRERALGIRTVAARDYPSPSPYSPTGWQSRLKSALDPQRRLGAWVPGASNT